VQSEVLNKQYNIINQSIGQPPNHIIVSYIQLGGGMWGDKGKEQSAPMYRDSID